MDHIIQERFELHKVRLESALDHYLRSLSLALEFERLVSTAGPLEVEPRYPVHRMAVTEMDFELRMVWQQPSLLLSPSALFDAQDFLQSIAPNANPPHLFLRYLVCPMAVTEKRPDLHKARQGAVLRLSPLRDRELLELEKVDLSLKITKVNQRRQTILVIFFRRWFVA